MKKISEMKLGSMNVRLIREGKDEFVEFFVRVKASATPKVKKLKTKKRGKRK